MLSFIRCKTRVLVACRVHDRIDLKDCYHNKRYKSREEVCNLVYSFYLDHLPNMRFVMLTFFYIVKCVVICATHASLEVVFFSLDFVLI